MIYLYHEYIEIYKLFYIDGCKGSDIALKFSHKLTINFIYLLDQHLSFMSITK
jgi:hypothetical protein